MKQPETTSARYSRLKELAVDIILANKSGAQHPEARNLLAIQLEVDKLHKQLGYPGYPVYPN